MDIPIPKVVQKGDVSIEKWSYFTKQRTFEA